MVWGGVDILQPLESISETLKHFANNITQLYEQCADEERIWEQVSGWFRWTKTGVSLQKGKVLF